MIYLDANVFIHVLTGDESRSKANLEFINKVILKKIEACTSFLTWDELSYVLKKEIGREQALLESKNFLQMPNLLFIDVTEEIITKAQKLMETYVLNPRDAIHAATAIINKCDKIASDDSDFDKIKELKRIKIN